MRRSICVIYRHPRAARKAYRAFIRSPLGARADSVTMHHQQMRNGRLGVSQMRPVSGALWGAMSMAVFGAVVLWVLLGSGATPALAPALAIVLGGAFGAGVGALAGALIGTTEPEKLLADAGALLVDGRAALVAEFENRNDAAGAKRLLMGLEGAESLT